MQLPGLKCPFGNTDCAPAVPGAASADNFMHRPHRPLKLPAMPTPQDRMQTKDLANAAHLAADAARHAPDRALTTVDTPYGSADVILDDAGADVVLHDRDVTVHVRRDGAKNEN